uniref:Uncharacterized protein n=1 Tax=Arundo donax TaxID=35708 RepID=A0A0A9HMB3_ARUDO
MRSLQQVNLRIKVSNDCQSTRCSPCGNKPYHT